MSRPEDHLPPDLFYDTTTARKYTTSSRIRHIQTHMTHRALSLLSLTRPSLLLDLGCGSGLSGSILSSVPPPEGPHAWVGMDISSCMLAEALDRDRDGDSDGGDGDGGGGDLFLADIGQGVPFRPGSFDGAISISAIQWLCNEDETVGSGAGGGGSADARLRRFFDGLYVALRRGARAVCQFYPRDQAQRDMICKAAVRAGFGAGVLEDDPGTKNAKLYLVLTVGGGGGGGGGDGGVGDVTEVVRGMEGVEVEDRRRGAAGARDAGPTRGLKKGGKGWILRKKEKMERQGKVVKANSRYTGRKRRVQF